MRNTEDLVVVVKVQIAYKVLGRKAFTNYWFPRLHDYKDSNGVVENFIAHFYRGDV